MFDLSGKNTRNGTNKGILFFTLSTKFLTFFFVRVHFFKSEIVTINIKGEQVINVLPFRDLFRNTPALSKPKREREKEKGENEIISFKLKWT